MNSLAKLGVVCAALAASFGLNAQDQSGYPSTTYGTHSQENGGTMTDYNHTKSNNNYNNSNHTNHSNYRANDEALKEQVDRFLRNTPATKNVEVTVESGVVTLEGTVNSEATKKTVESTVKNISGVKKVNNNLKVSVEKY